MRKKVELYLGLDIGSTTVKAVVLDGEGAILFKKYVRHFSEIRERTADLLRDVAAVAEGRACRLAMTGSPYAVRMLPRRRKMWISGFAALG